MCTASWPVSKLPLMVMRQIIFAPPGLKQTFCQSPNLIVRASRWPRTADSSAEDFVPAAGGAAGCAVAGAAARKASAIPARRRRNPESGIIMVRLRALQPLFQFVEKRRNHRRPDRNGIGGIHEEVAVAA